MTTEPDFTLLNASKHKGNVNNSSCNNSNNFQNMVVNIISSTVLKF